MSASEQDTSITPDVRAPQRSSAPEHPGRRIFTWIALGASLGLLIALGYLAAPLLFWAYNIERAGALIDTGMEWPAPRQVDSLPVQRDAGALHQALGHLAAAARWRPDHGHAYRLAGQVYMAQGDWLRAAEAYEQARARAPKDPLLAWESSLVYERMQRLIEEAPRESLMSALASGHVVAPGQLVKSLYCREGGAETCYFGQGTFTQPYAGSTDTTAVTFSILFLHPPASLHREITVPADRPALRFVVGLDPVARTWNSNGATFRVWAQARDHAATLVYEQTVDHTTAIQGWVSGWADLSPWTGQTITLVLESDPGPAGDLNDDWYGWGDVALTTDAARRYAALNPRDRMLAAWAAAGLTSRDFSRRAKEADQNQKIDQARTWRQRATEAKRNSL